MARIISAEELCNCPDQVTELCSDNCKHRHPHGTGRSLLERFRSQHGDVNWVTDTSHPASGYAYQEAMVNGPGVPGTWGRVIKDGRVLFMDRNRGECLRDYQRRIRAYMPND